MTSVNGICTGGGPHDEEGELDRSMFFCVCVIEHTFVRMHGISRPCSWVVLAIIIMIIIINTKG